MDRPPQGPVRNCGSCGCGDLFTVLDLGMQPLPQARRAASEVRYPLRLVECPRCTLVQLGYIVREKELFPPDYPYATGNTTALRNHFRELADFVDNTLPWDDNGNLVVDIGGNDGTMLKELRNLAPPARLLLVEPTDQSRKCEDPGISVVKEYFTANLADKILAGYGPAAVIVTSNTFGHVPDPHDFLDGITTLLGRDGTFIIENQDWQNVVNGLQVDTIYHEHLRYYSPASLSWMLARHGLLVTGWERISMHGGAFRATVVREKQKLGTRVNQLLVGLHQLLDEASAAGPIYAVGAPTRATPLVNYAGLEKYLTCTCEITGSEKIGATIPGTSVPIVDEVALFRDQPPYALLLAWDLESHLIPLLQRRGYKGTFIIPLPSPRFAHA